MPGLCLAGADTTVSAITTFFLAMMTYPEVFKKAQREVDKVAKGRLPNHDDIVSMPYLQALFKEVLRYVHSSLFISPSPFNEYNAGGSPLSLQVIIYPALRYRC